MEKLLSLFFFIKSLDYFVFQETDSLYPYL